MNRNFPSQKDMTAVLLEVGRRAAYNTGPLYHPEDICIAMGTAMESAVLTMAVLSEKGLIKTEAEESNE